MVPKRGRFGQVHKKALIHSLICQSPQPSSPAHRTALVVAGHSLPSECEGLFTGPHSCSLQPRWAELLPRVYSHGTPLNSLCGLPVLRSCARCLLQVDYELLEGRVLLINEIFIPSGFCLSSVCRVLLWGVLTCAGVTGEWLPVPSCIAAFLKVKATGLAAVRQLRPVFPMLPPSLSCKGWRCRSCSRMLADTLKRGACSS